MRALLREGHVAVKGEAVEGGAVGRRLRATLKQSSRARQWKEEEEEQEDTWRLMVG